MPVVSEDSAIEATANMTIYEQRLSHETVALLDSVLSCMCNGDVNVLF